MEPQRLPASADSLANYQGTIFARYATVPGDAGLDSDFGEAEAKPGHPAYEADVELLAPDDFNVLGPWPHQCQGLQGTDSFAPYQLADGTWASGVGNAKRGMGRSFINAGSFAGKRASHGACVCQTKTISTWPPPTEK